MTRKERRAAKAQRRRGMNVGDVIHVHHARDRKGRFCWLCGNAVHGPFASEKEMQEHSEATLLGPDAEISDGGMWDPNWDKGAIGHDPPPAPIRRPQPRHQDRQAAHRVNAATRRASSRWRVADQRAVHFNHGRKKQMTTFWISFSDPEASTAERFLGVAIIDMDETDGEKSVVEIVQECWRLGVNPGGQALIQEAQGIPEQFKNCLITDDATLLKLGSWGRAKSGLN